MSTPGKKEFSNPLLWAVAIMVFTTVVVGWFAFWMQRGELLGRQHPVEAPKDPNAEAETVDHKELITTVNDEVLALGEKVYKQKGCLACHAADGSKGNLATSRNFNAQAFANGGDPYSLYQTLKSGYNAMPAQPGLSPEEKYAVIHYIRETFTKPNNPSAYVEVTDEYLSSGEWATAGGEEDESGQTGPHPATVELAIPVYALMAREAEAEAERAAIVAVTLNQAAAVLADGPATTLRDRITDLNSAQGWHLLTTLKRDDFAAFVSAISGRSFNQLDADAALLDERAYQAAFEALKTLDLEAIDPAPTNTAPGDQVTHVETSKTVGEAP